MTKKLSKLLLNFLSYQNQLARMEKRYVSHLSKENANIFNLILRIYSRIMIYILTDQDITYIFFLLNLATLPSNI